MILHPTFYLKIDKNYFKIVIEISNQKHFHSFFEQSFSLVCFYLQIAKDQFSIEFEFFSTGIDFYIH
jgi:hypothetical protein